MKPLRVLLVMTDPPLPFGNAAARWYSVLTEGLVRRGHRVTVFSPAGSTDEIRKVAELYPAPDYDVRLFPADTAGGLRAKLTTLFRPMSRQFPRALRRDLESELNAGCDVLHLEQVWAGWLGLRYRDIALVNVLNQYRIDLRRQTSRGIADRLRRFSLFRAERRLTRSFHRFLAISDRLRGAVLRDNPTARVTVVPLGIDAGRYRYIPRTERPREPVVGLIGSMNWRPTATAAERLVSGLWPAIKRRVPDAKLLIVGWHARTTLGAHLGSPDVEIVENVPDAAPYFARLGILAYLPEDGSGVKVKVLEAMAYGIPVVTNTDGAEGLPLVDGVHAGLAETDAEAVERVVRLLRDPAAAERQRVAARSLVETWCGADATVDAVVREYRVIESACKCPGSP